MIARYQVQLPCSVLCHAGRSVPGVCVVRGYGAVLRTVASCRAPMTPSNRGCTGARRPGAGSLVGRTTARFHRGAVIRVERRPGGAKQCARAQG